MRSGYGDSRSLRAVLNFQDINLDALSSLEYFALYLLSFRKDRIDLSEIYADIAADITLDNTRNDLFLLALPLASLGLTALLADLL